MFVVFDYCGLNVILYDLILLFDREFNLVNLKVGYNKVEFELFFGYELLIVFIKW